MKVHSRCNFCGSAWLVPGGEDSVSEIWRGDGLLACDVRQQSVREQNPGDKLVGTVGG
jgi:hypothetical protein